MKLRATIGVLLGLAAVIAPAASGVNAGSVMRAYATSPLRANGPDPVERTIPLQAGAGAYYLELDQPHDRVVAYTSGVSGISILNARNGGLIATDPISGGPSAVAVDDKAGVALATDGSDGTLSIIDTGTGSVQQVVHLGGRPGAIVVDQRSSRAFVIDGGSTANGQGNSSSQGAQILVLDSRTGRTVRRFAIPFSGIIGNLALDSSRGRLYVQTPSAIGVYNAQSGQILHNISLSGQVESFAEDPSSGRILAYSLLNSGTSQGQVTLIDSATGAIVRRVNVPGINGYIAFAQREGRFFVATTAYCGSDCGLVTMFDSRSGLPIRSQAVGIHPGNLAVDERTGLVFVLNTSNPPQSIFVLDARTCGVVDSFGAFKEPASLVLDDKLHQAYVGDVASSSVSVINTTGWSAMRKVSVGRRPTAIAVAQGTNHAFVVDTQGNRVAMLDAKSGSVIRRTPVGTDPVAIAVDDGTQRVFVANYRARDVSVLDTQTGAIVKTVTVGHNPGALAVDARLGRVLVANGTSASVTILDSRSGAALKTIPVGNAPIALATDSRSGQAYVVNRDDNTVTVVDTRKGVKLATLTVGTSPDLIAVDEGHGRVYVGNHSANSISVIDVRTRQVVQTISTSGTPQALAVNPSSGDVLLAAAAPSPTTTVNGVSFSTYDSLTRYTPDGNRQESNSIGSGDHAIAFLGAGTTLVSNSTDDTVLVASTGTTSAASMPLHGVDVGGDPVALAVDRATRRVFVVDAASGDISILSTDSLA